MKHFDLLRKLGLEGEFLVAIEHKDRRKDVLSLIKKACEKKKLEPFDPFAELSEVNEEAIRKTMAIGYEKGLVQIYCGQVFGFNKEMFGSKYLSDNPQKAVLQILSSPVLSEVYQGLLS